MSTVEKFAVQVAGTTVRIEAFVTRLHINKLATKAEIIRRQPEQHTRRGSREADEQTAAHLGIPVSAVHHYGYIPPVPQRLRIPRPPPPRAAALQPCLRPHCRGILLPNGSSPPRCHLCGRTS